MNSNDEPNFRCPGESQPISLAVHLARMSSHFPKCRDCQYRDQNESLSDKTIHKIEAAWRQPRNTIEWFDEGLRGEPGGGLDRETVRQIALAFGTSVHEQAQGHTHDSRDEAPSVVLAYDGRPEAIETIEAAFEGIRHAGCRVVDLGGATAPRLTGAIEHLSADAGLFLGESPEEPRLVSLRFWSHGARPLSLGGNLDALRVAIDSPAPRPRRAAGGLRRFAGESIYLDDLREHYHALRPLRVGVITQSDPFWQSLCKLSAQVACRFTRLKHPSDVPSDQSPYHFTIQIEEDGEVCRLYDEQGQLVSGEATLVLLADFLLADAPHATVVLEKSERLCENRDERNTLDENIEERIATRRGRVVLAKGSRQAMDTAMRSSGAILGGGPSGRFWFGLRENPTADALRALTLLLNILSQSDRPLSRVVAKCWERNDLDAKSERDRKTVTVHPIEGRFAHKSDQATRKQRMTTTTQRHDE